MFMCLYCGEYFSATKGRSHHERRYCTMRLCQNIINVDVNAVLILLLMKAVH